MGSPSNSTHLERRGGQAFLACTGYTSQSKQNTVSFKLSCHIGVMPVSPSLNTCFPILSVFIDSFLKLFEYALAPLIYRIIFFQELNPSSTSQLQSNGSVRPAHAPYGLVPVFESRCGKQLDGLHGLTHVAYHESPSNRQICIVDSLPTKPFRGFQSLP